MGAVLLVEAARGLDLLLLLARRHVDLERPLDLLLLFGALRIEEIDPDGCSVIRCRISVRSSAPDRSS